MVVWSLVNCRPYAILEERTKIMLISELFVVNVYYSWPFSLILYYYRNLWLLLYLRMLAREAALSEVNFCAAEVDEKSDHHYPIFQENRNQTKRWMSQTLCKYCIYFF